MDLLRVFGDLLLCSTWFGRLSDVCLSSLRGEVLMGNTGDCSGFGKPRLERLCNLVLFDLCYMELYAITYSIAIKSLSKVKLAPGRSDVN